MDNLLNAINPWHLLFDFIGWCVVAVVVITLAASLIGMTASTLDGFLKMMKGPKK